MRLYFDWKCCYFTLRLEVWPPGWVCRLVERRRLRKNGVLAPRRRR